MQLRADRIGGVQSPVRRVGGAGVAADAAAAPLERLAHGRQDAADLAAEEDQGDDRHDRDEGEDERVLGQSLAFFPKMKPDVLSYRPVLNA